MDREFRLVVPPFAEVIRNEAKLACAVEELEPENLTDLPRPLDEEHALRAWRLSRGDLAQIG
jgi:hypothetical protein